MAHPSFIKNYMEYCECNEAPTNFHMWCAIVVISTLVSRKVWIPYGHTNIFTNLYVVLVGPPASRKSTAMGVAERYLRNYKKIPFGADATTREALIRAMAENVRTFVDPSTNRPIQYSPMTICATELSQFLIGSKENMIDLLTAMWDKDFFEYKTKNKGVNGESNHDEIFGPFLNLLACTTPSWISQYLKQDVISGGFSRRAMFVYSETRYKKIPIPEVTPSQNAAMALAVEAGKKIHELKGPFTWSPEGRKFFVNWYNNHTYPADPATLGYYDSKHTLLLKLAALYAAAERLELVLRVEDFKFALELLEITEVNLVKVLSGIGRNDLSPVAATFNEMLIREGGMIRAKTLRKETYGIANDKEFTEVTEFLIKTDQWVLGSVTDKLPDGREATREVYMTRDYVTKLKEKK